MLILDFSLFFYFIFVFFLFTLVLMLQVLSHFILVLVFLDLLLIANILIFILSTIVTQNPIGYITALIVIGVAAADTAIGLGLFILYFRSTNQVSIENIVMVHYPT
jgi:NADH-quinone oxidoreductase subunit K